jgi:hypothetical protein
MTPTNVNPHPEWKRLAKELEPLVATTRFFTYEVLAALSGIDVRTSRGRGQFQRFRKFALAEWGLWFECEIKRGYRVAEDDEIPSSAMRRMQRGRRQFGKSLAIAVRTKEDGVPDAVIAARRQLSASLGALMQATDQEAKKIRPLLRNARPKLLSSGAETLDAIRKRTG